VYASVERRAYGGGQHAGRRDHHRLGRDVHFILDVATVISQLQEAGVKRDEIDQMTRANPRALFAKDMPY
jgi:predicted metal-dependent phosphotriesterase family hydrolase